MDPINLVFFSAISVVVIALYAAAKGFVDYCIERLCGWRDAASNEQFAEQAVQHMWQRVSDKGLEGIDQAVFVCMQLTEIQRKYGCSPMANVNVIDSKGRPNFICVGAK